MQLRGVFRIKEHKHESGTISWRVSGMHQDGRRVRESFLVEAEAIGRKQSLEMEALNIAPSAGLQRTKLTPEQIEDAERALAELAGKTTCANPLFTAARYFSTNYREPFRKITVEDAFKQFIEEKKRANKRPQTISNLEAKAKELRDTYGTRDVSEITYDQIRALIFKPTRGPVACDNSRRAISSFFEWTKVQEYCAENPCSKIQPVEIDRGEPGVLAISDVRKLMEMARTYKDGAMVPYAALGMFAAIRPTELSRISWDDIDLKAKTVTIGAKLAKMRQRRIVELSQNCVDWLLPHAVKKTPIHGVNWRRNFEKVKELAGFGEAKPYVQDVMRHTGISFHLAKHQHEGKTATWAGNSPDVIQKHYKGLVTQKDASAFWQIRPDAQKIVKVKFRKTVGAGNIAKQMQA